MLLGCEAELEKIREFLLIWDCCYLIHFIAIELNSFILHTRKWNLLHLLDT